MSYDFAVWDGERPANPDDARGIFDALYRQYVESGEQAAPTPKIRAFVEALLARIP